MNNIKIDIISDLHIEQWDSSIENKYPSGKIKNFPYNVNKKSNILIIAGDISDNLEISLEYLNKLSEKYDSILFVDGNHEHTLKYPNLYTIDEIQNKLNKLNKQNIYYLPKTHIVINNTVIFGICGWWDYNNQNKDCILENKDYFKGWINHFTENDNLEFINNVIKRSTDEYLYLKKYIELYNDDNNINNIIVVSHTIPLFEYLKNDNIENSNKKSNGCNSKFKEIIDNNKKISHWIFGHTHEQIEFNYNNINFICHPRGRPEDFNREKYELKTIDI